MRRSAPVIITAVLVGLMLGAAISVAAFYVARYGPSGGSWSFRGNGALVVYTAIPAVMAAGWTALALHARTRSWLWPGIGTGLVALVIAAVAAALLPVFGPTADSIGSPIALLALLAWTLGAPLAALLIRAAPPVQSLGTHLVAGGLWFVAAAVGLVAVGILVPAGS